MRAENEVTVDRLEFKKAVSWINRGKRHALETTVLRMSDSGFVVEAPRAVTSVKSSGRWTTAVSANAVMLKKLIDKIPAKKEITCSSFTAGSRLESQA